MRRLFLLAAFLLLCAPRASAQLHVPGFAADPATCDSTRGLIYYNTVSQTFKSCGPSPNTWSGFANSGTVTSVAATSPIVVTPNPIIGVGTISCPTCLIPSSTIPINQVISATGRISSIAIGDNTLPFTCAQATIPDCVTIIESSPTPVSAGNAHLLLIQNTAGSNAAGLVVFSQVNAAPSHNAPPILYIQGETGGLPTASQNGFTGASWNIFAGDGSPGGATTGTGGTGGNASFNTGNGGAAGGASANAGGNGGQMIINMGNGAAGGATGNGGAGGVLNFNGGGGAGGNGGATSGNGGAGSDLTFAGGNGGTAAAGSTTGRGGDISFSMGTAGTGAGATIARPGRFLLSQSVQGANVDPTEFIQTTWNTTGIVDAAIKLAVTDTASNAASLLMDLIVGVTTEFKIQKNGNVTANGTITAPTYATATNCVSIGTGANPSVASCTAAAAGSISCAATQTVCQVNTTAVTANSEIFLSQRLDTTTGTRLSVTCNTTPSTIIASQNISAVVAGTSFTFNITAPVTNPDCFSYWIVN